MRFALNLGYKGAVFFKDCNDNAPNFRLFYTGSKAGKNLFDEPNTGLYRPLNLA